MCGINGFVSNKFTVAEREKVVAGMNACLAHRGPDNEGMWSEGDVSFGQRRLSIIDLSEEGNQPFFSSDKRYVIVYNGELYNYRELKLELQRSSQGSAELPYFFSTASDTEVVLAAYIRWGKGCLEYFNGMFAFAIYDRESKEVFAARDPLGVKPFYYSFSDEGFLFSSELRPILKSGVRKFAINKSVLAEYAMYQTVLAPATIVQGIKVLMPGHTLQIKNSQAEMACYFDITKNTPSPEISYQEACTKVRELLGTSIQRRLVADVPFGAFLSGGIDSSAVVALMSQVSTSPVSTFNISFDESEFSESQYARLIAKKYNTKHHEIKLRPDDFLQQLPEALAAMDHPGGDGPNTYIVSKATKNAGITMALSGIGGDELFAGYAVFKRMHELSHKTLLAQTPQFIRSAAGRLMLMRKRDMSTEKIAELLSQPEINLASAYPRVRSVFTQKQNAKLISDSPFLAYETLMKVVPQFENKLLSSVSVAEIYSYLQNVLLRDADQMSMAVALEVREPFLDKHLVKFVLSLNDSFKFPHTPKKLLVDSLGDLLPPEIVNRPKMGFTLPWQQWLRGELKEFCEKQIMVLEQLNLFNTGEVMDLWKRFLANDPVITWSRVWHLIILGDWVSKHQEHLNA